MQDVDLLRGPDVPPGDRLPARAAGGAQAALDPAERQQQSAAEQQLGSRAKPEEGQAGEEQVKLSLLPLLICYTE